MKIKELYKIVKGIINFILSNGFDCTYSDIFAI